MAVKILVAGWDKQEFDKICKFADKQKIETIIIINKNDENKTVSDIIKNENNLFGNILDEKLILFYGMTNKKISDFINGFKKLSLTYPLFAMVTPHSIKWELKKLLKHLNEERNAVMKK
jgi:hypothetical protein